MATITRVFEFDAAHRVMNERVKCFNLHGHCFRLEVTFDISQEYWGLGYPIDFKELKRIFGGFIDQFLDHACILNPQDDEIINMCDKNNWRMWVMGFCLRDIDKNPSAENLADELFVAFKELATLCPEKFTINSVRLYETPNCWVDVNSSETELTETFRHSLTKWRESMGNFEYDARKCQ